MGVIHLEIQKPSFLHVSMNLGKPVIQKQIGQNAELPDTTSELGLETENTRMEQFQQTQFSIRNDIVSMSNAKEMIEFIEPVNTHLSFSIDENTNETVISIIDNKSGEVIRSIPPDEILRMKERMIKLHGVLFDVKA